MKINLLMILSLSLLLVACGDESPDAAKSKTERPSSAGSSKLSQYMSEDKVCDVLDDETLNTLFAATTEIKKRAGSFRDNFSCSYSWPRPDAEERQKNITSAMLASMTGEGPKQTMRDRMLEYQVTIGLRPSQRTADNFVPRKLTEEQMNQQIAAAKKRANERLTEEQKEVAGDAANNLVESMLRKNNENEEVAGVGDAAFWTKLGSGSLEILAGNVQLTVSPIIASTQTEDSDNAKRIASALLD